MPSPRKAKSTRPSTNIRKLIRLKPDHAQAHNDLGADLDRQGHIDEAIDEYQEAIRLKPDYAEAITTSASPLSRKATPTRPSASSRKR